jgi:signal transduction histidine kinase
MTFQRRLLLGFSLMVLPVVLVGAEAIRSKMLADRALEALGQSLARARTYSEVETAMFNESEVVWRYLTGMDPHAKRELRLHGEVVDYWLDRWTLELRPDERELATGVRDLQRQIQAVSERVFELYDRGEKEAAYTLARVEFKERLHPALTNLSREIYRRARVLSVKRAFDRVEEIVATERRILLSIVLLSLIAVPLLAWLITRSLARPLQQLSQAMAVVGAGNLEHPIDERAKDEIGDLARAFARMTDRLRQSRADMVRLNAELEAKVSQLQQAQAQLVQSEKLASIGEVSAAVAHGMRNPLASLRAAAQLALKHPESPAAREQLGSIVSEVDRLDQRVSHLLSFSRPAPFHPLRENASQLVEGLLPGFAELIRAHGVQLELALSTSLPDVRVDPMQLEQALVEILSNALDAMPDGGRLKVATAARDGGGITIEVADTGRGIPAETLGSVCEPFFTTRADGTGLGLATAKRYVEQNGGRLEIESRVGAGTKARIWLPAADAESPALTVPARPA